MRHLLGPRTQPLAAPPARSTALLVALLAASVLLTGCAAGNPTGESPGDREDPEEGASLDEAADTDLVVGAAADLRPAFEDLGEQLTDQTGIDVAFVFGSSGQLAQQAIEGAPVDVYASANVDYVEAVLDSGRGDPDSQQTYAQGRIVIWTRAEADQHWTDLHELADAEAGAEPLAIANPEHAPYGRAAQEALASTGVWDEAQPRLVYGENIADTHRLAASGNADAAITALSLALAADLDASAAASEAGAWTLIDAEAHEPLQQDLVVTAEDPARAERAAAFVDLVGSDEGRATMRDYGFLLPGEDPPPAWEE